MSSYLKERALTKRAFFRFRTGLLTFLFLVLAFFQTGCRQDAPIPPETQKTYAKSVGRFCGLVANCLRLEMDQRLADEAQRRVYLATRMTPSACADAQLRRLQQSPGTVQDLDSCSGLLETSNDCSARLHQLREHDSCRRALQL